MSSLIGTRQDASLRNPAQKKHGDPEGPVDILPTAHRHRRSRRQPARRLAIRCSRPETSAVARLHAQCEKYRRESEVAHAARTQVWTDYNAFGRAIDVQHQHVDRITEIIMIKLVVADAMQPDRCARRYHKIERRASRRPSANCVGNPPGAIRFSLMKVTRTKPHVACGSSFSRARISSAVRS